MILSGIGGMPIKTKNGSWYSYSVGINDVHHARRKGPLNWSGNLNTTTMFSPLIYRAHTYMDQDQDFFEHITN